MNKTNNISYLYNQIEGKLKFVKFVSEHFKVPYHQVRVNWLSFPFTPPENHVIELTKILQNKIINQNK